MSIEFNSHVYKTDKLQELILNPPIWDFPYSEKIVDDLHSGYRYIIGFYYNHAVAYVVVGFDVDTDKLKQPHGGFTYHEKFCPFINKEIITIGWDYGHAGDYIKFPEHEIDGRVWSIGDIKEDCLKVISSLPIKDIKECYQEAVERAKENLKGEDLEKCLIALSNYMDHVQNS